MKAATTATETQKADLVFRDIPHCKCSYQAEKAWGYSLHKRVGGSVSWKWLPVGSAITHEDIEKNARPFPIVLIRCNGCGADMVREHQTGLR